MDVTHNVAAGMNERPRRSAARLASHIVLHALMLLVGIAAFIAHEHFEVQGASTASLASLVTAAVFGLAPLRLLLRELGAIEGTVAHLAHAVGGFSLIGLTVSGAIPSGPMLDHAAQAPFAIMGAAQAIMHQNRPRDAAQAAALRQFATSLPQLEVVARPGALASPENARRAVGALTDVVTKAEALGETELRGDLQFQSAWQQATTRVGLSLGLDAVDRAADRLAGNPASAGAVAELRRRVAAARKTIGG